MIHPLFYIIGSFACVVGFAFFGAIGFDAWERGRRGIALCAFALAAVCVLGVNAGFNLLEQAYAERMQRGNFPDDDPVDNNFPHSKSSD